MRQGRKEKKKKKERLLSDASSLTVSMVLRDQMRIRRLGSEYKNMRMFTRREGAEVETPRLDIEPWILAAACTQACRSRREADFSVNQSE